MQHRTKVNVKLNTSKVFDVSEWICIVLWFALFIGLLYRWSGSDDTSCRYMMRYMMSDFQHESRIR